MKATSLLLASLALALAGAPASAQTPWTQTATVRASDYDPAVDGAGVTVLVLAADESLVLTDVVMTHNINTTSNTFRANIKRGSASNATPCASATPVLAPYVSPDETVSLNLTTGIAFAAGEQICVVIGGAIGSEGVSFTFLGLKTN
jgi:hypothetical protein